MMVSVTKIVGVLRHDIRREIAPSGKSARFSKEDEFFKGSLATATRRTVYTEKKRKGEVVSRTPHYHWEVSVGDRVVREFVSYEEALHLVKEAVK